MVKHIFNEVLGGVNVAEIKDSSLMYWYCIEEDANKDKQQEVEVADEGEKQDGESEEQDDCELGFDFAFSFYFFTFLILQLFSWSARRTERWWTSWRCVYFCDSSFS